MSLWYQNLDWCLEDAKTAEERAKCILAHLSMPVPRQWWETSLRLGAIPDTYKNLLISLYCELIEIAELKNRVDFVLLIALAFVENFEEQKMNTSRYIDSLYFIDDYIEKARQVLSKSPELKKLVDNVEFDKK